MPRSPHGLAKRTRSPIRFSALFLASLLVAAPTLALERDHSETHPLEKGGRISLESINGDVEIVSADVDEVTIHWTVSARNEEAMDRVRVEVDARPERIRITTDQDDWRGWRGSSWSIDFELQVPRSAKIDDFELVNGSLTMKGRHQGAVQAELVNGAIRADELGEDVSLTTVNGSIDVTITDLTPNARIDLESVNGSVELTLPEGAAFDIRAETIHGRIRNDFGIPVDEDEWVGRSMNGRTAEGGGRIRIETVNGGIELRSR